MKMPVLVIGMLLLGLVAGSGAIATAGAGPVTLSGHVQDADGLPFEGVNITIFDTENEIALSPELTDEDGNFSVTLGPGSYSVSATYKLHNANTSYTGLSDSADDLDFTMSEAKATITGYVTDGLSTLYDVKVTLSNSTVSFSSYSTSPYGRYVIENVTAGTYIAIAEKDGYEDKVYPDPVAVTPGEVLFLNYTLTALANRPAHLTGTVTYDGDPVQGVKVVLSPLDGSEDIIATTDANGFYNFTRVTAGQYDLMLTKSGFVGSSQRVTLSAGQEVDKDIVLKKDSLPGTSGFLLDYDLAHSLMIVALGFALFTTFTALFIRYRAGSKPEILENEEDSG